MDVKERAKQKIILNMAETYHVTNQKPPLVNKAVKSGDLKTFLIGRRRFARLEDVEAWVDYLERESDAGRPVKYQAREQERPVKHQAPESDAGHE